MRPLTKRQQEILKYLATFIEKHGHSPTLKEIRRNFELRSLATVHSHLAHLQTRGWIKRDKNQSRSITLVPATEQRPGIRMGAALLRRRPHDVCERHDKTYLTRRRRGGDGGSGGSVTGGGVRSA